MQEYLIKYGTEKGYLVNKDTKGNIYFTKGSIKEKQYFPCVCAHIDSVFNEHIDLIKNNKRKDIRIGRGKHNKTKLMAFHPETGKRTGLAGDDLAGVFLCLQMLEHFDNLKAAFFVEEEYGCRGSNECDKTFFNNVGYVIQFDGPTSNWFTETLSGVKMYNDDFLTKVKPILEKYNVTNYSDDPYTDILPLKEKFDFCCCNLPTGYHNWHTNEEYVNFEQTEKCIQLGIDFINKLGYNKYQFDKAEFTSFFSNSYESYLKKYDKYMEQNPKFVCDICGSEMDEYFICTICGHNHLTK
ncbi:MAG: hypothetical protein HPY57_15780 [Ignavibacteria bacterium]|nr:hypothetical protein [Ignavibacteria bacterium]